MGSPWYLLGYLPQFMTCVFYLGILTVAITFFPRFRYCSCLVMVATTALLLSELLSYFPFFMARYFGQFSTVAYAISNISTNVLHVLGIAILVWAVFVKRPPDTQPTHPSPNQPRSD